MTTTTSSVGSAPRPSHTAATLQRGVITIRAGLYSNCVRFLPPLVITNEELTEELMKLRKEQFNLRMQAATGQLARPHEYGKVRRNIARIKTVLREKERAAEAK